MQKGDSMYNVTSHTKPLKYATQLYPINENLMSCYPVSKKQAMEVPLKLNKMAVLMGIGLCHCSSTDSKIFKLQKCSFFIIVSHK
jgi:hypothetical protein